MQNYEKYMTESEMQGVKGFAEKVKRLLGPSLLEFSVFGSKVRGDFDQESDIDILVIMESEDWHVREEVVNIAADINMEYGCNISPVIYSRREHEMNRYFGTLFIKEIEREGIPIA